MIEKADKLRKEQEMTRLKQQVAEAARKAGMERDLALVSNTGLRTEPPPFVEWWDAKLLPNESYDEVVVGELVDVLGDLINSIVQHPVPIEPPLEEGVVVPIKPLLLTQMVSSKCFSYHGRGESNHFFASKINVGEEKVEKTESLRSTKRKTG